MTRAMSGVRSGNSHKRNSIFGFPRTNENRCKSRHFTNKMVYCTPLLTFKTRCSLNKALSRGLVRKWLSFGQTAAVLIRYYKKKKVKNKHPRILKAKPKTNIDQTYALDMNVRTIKKWTSNRGIVVHIKRGDWSKCRLNIDQTYALEMNFRKIKKWTSNRGITVHIKRGGLK